MSSAARTLTVADGDVVYLSLQVPNAARAREFYGSVLGWLFGADRRHVEGQAIPIGIVEGWTAEGVGNPGVFTVRRVADLEAAVRRVRELGGTATDPHREPYGLATECTDNQGLAFGLIR